MLHIVAYEHLKPAQLDIIYVQYHIQRKLMLLSDG